MHLGCVLHACCMRVFLQFVCVAYALCLHYVSHVTHAACIVYACCMHVVFMHVIRVLYALCMHVVRMLHVSFMHFVCRCHACCMYACCMHLVWKISHSVSQFCLTPCADIGWRSGWSGWSDGRGGRDGQDGWDGGDGRDGDGGTVGMDGGGRDARDVLWMSDSRRPQCRMRIALVLSCKGLWVSAGCWRVAVAEVSGWGCSRFCVVRVWLNASASARKLIISRLGSCSYMAYIFLSGCFLTMSGKEAVQETSGRRAETCFLDQCEGPE